jgi:prephenate dehydrogenase
MWTGIALENAEWIGAALERMERELATIRSALERGDEIDLHARLAAARKWFAEGEAFA